MTRERDKMCKKIGASSGTIKGGKVSFYVHFMRVPGVEKTVLDRSTSWVLLTLFGAKIANIVFAILLFFNP